MNPLLAFAIDQPTLSVITGLVIVAAFVYFAFIRDLL